MKRYSILSVFVLLAAITLLTSGCATSVFPGGPTVAGGLYTEIVSPAQNLSVALDADARPLRRGESANMAFLGLFAFGDAGVNEAMKNGGISRIHHVDHKVQHFLQAIYAKDTTIVYGE